MTTAPAPVRPAAWTCHAIGLLLCLAPLGDLAAGLGSLNPGAVPWRFGAAGLLSGALVLPMLGLGLLLLGGVLLEHRGLLRLLSVVAALACVTLLGILVVFVLDTFQVRVQVPPDATRVFDLAAAKAVGTFGLAAIVLGVLAVQSHRAARALRGLQARRRAEGRPVVMPNAER